jgi:hypothetical protein
MLEHSAMAQYADYMTAIRRGSFDSMTDLKHKIGRIALRPTRSSLQSN